MMRIALAAATLALVVSVTTVPARGHHSYAASYFEDQIVSIEGTLTELEIRNPHSWVHLQAVNKEGLTRTVSAEWASPGRLSEQGVSKDTLRLGDRLILTGSPSRNPSDNKLHLKKIERPADGWTWAGRGQTR